MSWVAIGAAGTIIPSVSKMISGGKQKRQGQQILDATIRPTYNRPSEIRDASAIAANNYFNPQMPGAAMLEAQLGSAGATALDSATQAATNSGDVLDAVSKLNYGQGQQLNALNAQKTQYAEQAKQQYLNQLGIDAQFTDKEFDVNSMQPYVNDTARGQALLGAGNLNSFGGMSDLSKLGAGITTAQMNNKLIYDPKKKEVKPQ